MDILEQIKEYATAAHGDQKRKYRDELYINHPIRVSEHCQRHVNNLPIAAAALLHDVLEDTDIKEEEMEVFLQRVMPAHAAHTLRLVKDLTDVYTHKAYPLLNRRRRKEKEAERLAATHPDAQTIKYADIIDNSQDIVGSGDDFSQKFLQECKTVLKKIPKGNEVLYKEAVEAVERGLKSWRQTSPTPPREGL
ncbi:MAG TPA: HD domain-containing protein [Chitinophagaceae bacterium]|nr:HD domain-containing protein [Chitinophagaceae bacterium]